MYKLLFVYNFVGFLVSLFLALKTTPAHFLYEYSKILVSLNLYQHIPFFWDLTFYSAFVLSIYYLFDGLRDLGGFSSGVKALLRWKSNRADQVASSVVRILNASFCLVCWTFIKYYRSERDKSHSALLRHQENTEYDFLKKSCLKIK